MSHSVLDQMNSSITPQLILEAAKSLGESPDATKQAVHLALPALLSGVAGATRMPSGLSTVLRLVEDPVNDGTLSTQLTSLYSGTMSGSPIYRLGSQLLNAIFGGKLPQLAQGVAALSGIKTGSASTLLHMLAPNVLAVLGNDHRAVADKSPEGFARFIERQKAGLAATLAPTLAEIVRTPMGAAAPVVGAVVSSVPKGAQEPRRVEATAHGAGVKPVLTEAPMKAAVAKPVGTKQSAAAVAPATEGDYRRQSQTMGWKPGARPALVFLTLLGLGLLYLGFGLSGTKPSGEKSATTTVSHLPAPGQPAPIQPAQQKAAATKPVPAPEAAALPAAESPEGTKPVPAAAPVKSEPKAAVGAKTASAVASSKASPPMPVNQPGVTSFYGQDKVRPERPAVANPDYKPAVAVAAAAPIVLPEIRPIAPVPGTTHYFGISASQDEAPAVANPDYEPIRSASATDTAAATNVAEEAPPPPVPGTTSYFGTSAAREELPAIANPNYKVATEAAVVATVVVPEERRAAPAPGITNYFGISAAAVEAPAMPNPAYKAATVAANAATAPAPVPSAKTLEPQSGITTYFGQASDPHSPVAVAAASAPACAQSVADAAKSGVVLFRSGRADLTASSMPMLKRVVRAFKDCPGMRLRIEGHTDDTGGAEMNLRLSKARAQSVANYLVLRGIDPGRVVSTGYGMSQPVAPNSTAVNKALNRRIEFKVDKM